MKLYHYVHCPFCVRVRMALGLLGINYESKVLPYDDEITPVKLADKKMLPIFEWKSGDASNESLDIIARCDDKNILKNNLVDSKDFQAVEDFLAKIGSNVHSLCMPYWIWTPEFNDKSRKYFQDKKEIKRGPFKDLIKDKQKYIDGLDEILNILETNLEPYFRSKELTIYDICLASHLWGMYVFPEYQFSPKIHDYLQTVSRKCGFDYHEDFWK